MNFEDKKNPREDAQVAEALRHFRDSVHAWSEQEYVRPRTIRHSRWAGFWRTMASPMLAWTFAAALLVTSVGAPVAVHHEHVLAMQKQEALEKQQKLAAEEAERARAAAAIDDEELLSHVDSDIAQATPDAMEPLASMMSQSNQ